MVKGLRLWSLRCLRGGGVLQHPCSRRESEKEALINACGSLRKYRALNDIDPKI